MELTLYNLAKEVAEKALNEITYEGKTIREWVEIIVKQQPCEDCISREAVEKITWEEPSYDDALNVLTEVRDKVRALPSVTPSRPKGRWMRKTKVDGVYDIGGVKTWGIKCQCDRCDFTTTVIEDFGYYTYCPKCGADMRESEDSK